MDRGNDRIILLGGLLYLLGVILICTILIDVKVALLLLPLLGLLLYYLVFVKKEIQSLPALIEPTTSFRQGLWKNTLNELGTAVAIVDKNNKVIWKNKVFIDNFQAADDRIKDIGDIIPPDILNSLNDQCQEIEINERHFSLRKALFPKERPLARQSKGQ